MQSTFEIESPLAASSEALLAHAATMTGVNRELGPFLRMTMPAHLRGASLFDAPTATPLFRSWLLLFGVVPIDYDDLQLTEIDPASGFVESSSMLAISHWRHERRIRARPDGGSVVLDRLTFEPRIEWTRPLIGAIVRALFQHRHRRLRRLFGHPVELSRAVRLGVSTA